MELIAVREGLSEARCRNKWLFPAFAVVAACARQSQAKTSETGGVLQVGKCSSKQQARLVLLATHGCVIQNNSII